MSTCHGSQEGNLVPVFGSKDGTLVHTFQQLIQPAVLPFLCTPLVVKVAVKVVRSIYQTSHTHKFTQAFIKV